MYLFLIPLLAGFISNLASAFTTTYSEKWGPKTGTFITIILRDVLGIPVWAAGYVMAIDESADLFYRTGFISNTVGLCMIIAGSLIIIIALLQLRIKAAAPSTKDNLTRSGIYSVVRHPIHIGTALEFIALFIIWPSISVTIAVISGLIWLVLQSIFEERDLIRRIPDYKDYMNEVPGFLPKKILK